MGRHRFAKNLREAGLTCEVHDDHFPQNTDDVDWILPVGAKGWIAVTRDTRIRRNEVEKRAVVRGKLGVLVLKEGTRTTEEMAADFVLALPVIEKFLEMNRQAGGEGFVASLLPPSKKYEKGRVNPLFPKPAD